MADTTTQWLVLESCERESVFTCPLSQWWLTNTLFGLIEEGICEIRIVSLAVSAELALLYDLFLALYQVPWLNLKVRPTSSWPACGH